MGAALCIGSVAVGAGTASATPPSAGVHKVAICHRTNSVTNPYVMVTVDEASVNADAGDDRGQGDHNAEHNGPVFDSTATYPKPMRGDEWGDIIPLFYSDGTTAGYWASKNWPSGQAIFENGCAPVLPTTTTEAPTTTTETPGTTEAPTTTIVGSEGPTTTLSASGGPTTTALSGNGGTLPTTGSSQTLLVVLGMLMVLGGLVFLALTRRVDEA